MEIDLLRGGTHTTAVPHDRLIRSAGDFDYHVCIHHFDNLEDYLVYAWRLPEPIPEVAIPLLPGDPSWRSICRPFSSAPTTRGRIGARSITGGTRRCRRSVSPSSLGCSSCSPDGRRGRGRESPPGMGGGSRFRESVLPRGHASFKNNSRPLGRRKHRSLGLRPEPVGTESQPTWSGQSLNLPGRDRLSTYLVGTESQPTGGVHAARSRSASGTYWSGIRSLNAAAMMPISRAVPIVRAK